MRWVKDGQVISPGEYIPLLERSGYVVMLDQYIWERVFERQRAMLDQGVETITCSVNVSRIDFELIDVAQLFASLKEKYRIDPKLIGIEVTESAYADNYDTVQKTVSRLRELGFRLVLQPLTALLAAARAVLEALGWLRAHPAPAQPGAIPFDTFTDLVGLRELQRLDARFAA